jgi:hypothetical protein
MTRTIQIKFLSLPVAGNTFKFTLKFTGAPSPVPGGIVTIDKFFAAGNSAPNGIAIGTSINTAMANTMANLNSFNNYSGVTYSVLGNSIYVYITFSGTVTIENASQTGNALLVSPGGQIVFEKDINEGKLRMAYNNDVVKFYSESANQPLYCDITALGLDVRIYPNPFNRFYFNFKPYVSAIINSRQFEDTIEPDINGLDPNSFSYSFTSGTFMQRGVTFTITFDGGFTDTSAHILSWLAGVEQLGDYHNFSVAGLYVLSPFKKLSTNSYYLKYWQGYPFDISLYLPATSYTLKNDTNLMSQTFNGVGYGDRLYFSDGRTDESIENVLPLLEGFNSLRLMPTPASGPETKYILLEKIPYKCGVYLKWLNKYGGYSYWLFEDTYTIDRSTKQVGELDRSNSNLEDSFGTSIQIGKESQDTIKVVAELLTGHERTIVEGLLDTPKIYLFTGQPYARNSSRDWVEVTLKTTSTRLKNAKQPLTNFSFDLELPQRYTQML